MAKSPMKPYTKYSLASNRFRKKPTLSRISLKNRCFVLPVKNSLSSLALARKRNAPFSKIDLRSDPEFKSQYEEKLKIMAKLNQLKIHKNAEKRDLKGLLANLPKKKRTNHQAKGKDSQIGIFEREHVSYSQVNNILSKKKSCKNQKKKLEKKGLGKEPALRNNRGVDLVKKHSPLKIEENSAKKKLTNVKKARLLKNKNLPPSLHHDHIRHCGQKAKLIFKNETFSNRDSRHKHISKRDQKVLTENTLYGNKKKDLDAMTVNTCNTLTGSTSPCMIQEEGPKRKDKVVKLTELQKYFLAYEGNFVIKPFPKNGLTSSIEIKTKPQNDFLLGPALHISATTRENGRLDHRGPVSLQAK